MTICHFIAGGAAIILIIWTLFRMIQVVNRRPLLYIDFETLSEIEPNACQCRDENDKPLNRCEDCPR